MKKITLKEIITCLITIAFGIASGLGIGINIKTNGDGTIEIETKLGIELSEKQGTGIQFLLELVRMALTIFS